MPSSSVPFLQLMTLYYSVTSHFCLNLLQERVWCFHYYLDNYNGFNNGWCKYVCECVWNCVCLNLLARLSLYVLVFMCAWSDVLGHCSSWRPDMLAHIMRATCGMGVCWCLIHVWSIGGQGPAGGRDVSSRLSIKTSNNLYITYILLTFFFFFLYFTAQTFITKLLFVFANYFILI